jgi:intracellular multiplication protein IcmQ
MFKATTNNVENKQQKIESLQRIDNNITETLEGIRALYAIEDKKASIELIKILDNLLDSNDWESSLLLRTTKKHLGALREEAKQIADKLNDNVEVKLANQVKTALKPDQIKIYISLYQAEGANLQAWQKMLKSLANYSITRPVYENEEHVREVIRTKPDMQRHAYAVVAISKNSIIHLEKPSVDQFSHELLSLKEGAVQLQNIIEFVHANEKRYVFRNDTLVLIK